MRRDEHIGRRALGIEVHERGKIKRRRLDNVRAQGWYHREGTVAGGNVRQRYMDYVPVWRVSLWRASV